jgi:hypothetical protein
MLEVPEVEVPTWPQYEPLEELEGSSKGQGGQAQAQEELPYHVVYRVLASERRPLRALIDELKDDPRNPVKTRQVMYELYKEHGFSTKALALALGMRSPGAVHTWLDTLGIPMAKRGMRFNVLALGPEGLMDHRVDSEGRHLFVYYLKESEPLAYVAGFALGDGSPSWQRTAIYSGERGLLERVREEAERLAEELSAKALSARVTPIYEEVRKVPHFYVFYLHVDGPAREAGDALGNTLLEADYREAFVRGLLRGPYKHAFLAGLWDADGHIDVKRRRAELTQASHNWWILELIKGELEAQGLHPYLSSPYVTRHINVETGRERTSVARKLRVSGDEARRLCELMLPHLKRDKLRMAVELLKGSSASILGEKAEVIAYEKTWPELAPRGGGVRKTTSRSKGGQGREESTVGVAPPPGRARSLEGVPRGEQVGRIGSGD